MKSTSSSGSRRKVASASALSLGGPQMPVAGDAHGAETQAMDVRLAANRESS